MALVTITEQQANEYLEAQGISLSGFVLTDLLSAVGGVLPCFELNGYAQWQVNLICCCVLGIVGLAQSTSQIASEGAPSGASRSFAVGSIADRVKALHALLKSADPKGCALSIIPADTNAKAFAGMWLASGVEGE